MLLSLISGFAAFAGCEELAGGGVRPELLSDILLIK